MSVFFIETVPMEIGIYIVVIPCKGVITLNIGAKMHFNVKKLGLLRPFLYLCKTKQE